MWKPLGTIILLTQLSEYTIGKPSITMENTSDTKFRNDKGIPYFLDYFKWIFNPLSVSEKWRQTLKRREKNHKLGLPLTTNCMSFYCWMLSSVYLLLFKFRNSWFSSLVKPQISGFSILPSIFNLKLANFYLNILSNEARKTSRFFCHWISNFPA